MMAEWEKVVKQIARDICKDNKICTCNEKDGHCISVMMIAEKLAKQGYKPPCTQKEKGADNPKITCLNCKHLVFSDMYGECNKKLRIVYPSDTCEFAELKEKGR